MATQFIKNKTNMSIRRQVGYWLMGMYITLSVFCVLFLFLPMMYFWFRPLSWDVEYISIKPITVEVGKPLWFESTRHNKTDGTNIFSDTLVCVDGDGNVLFHDVAQTLRDVSAQDKPRTAPWEYKEGQNFAINKTYDKCRIQARISRIRPFVGLVSQRLDSDWFTIE